MGVTGQKILRAIVGGERDAEKLAAMRNERIQASCEEIVASLTGNWRPELLFCPEAGNGAVRFLPKADCRV